MSSYLFPATPGLGPKTRRSPIDTTSIQGTTSTRELRLSRADRPRWRYQLSFPFLRSASAYKELQTLESFIERHSGRHDSFLWTDPEDNSVTSHGFGVGNATTTAFQLQRTRGGNFSDVVSTWPSYDQPRTNLVAYSTDYSNAWWTKGATTAANATVWAPDGSLNADTITDTSANSVHYVATTAITTVAATVYTFSVYAKFGAAFNAISLAPDSGVSARFDLTTGAVSAVTGCTALATSAAGFGWRCSVTYAASGTNTLPTILLNGGAIYVGGSGKVHLWHSQFEPGALATRPIATAGAALSATPAYWPTAGDGFEPVTEPAPGISVWSAGALKTPGTDYTLGSGTGVITFGSAPASGAALTWSGSYYKRVRFDDQEHDFERIVQELWELGTLDLISVI